MLLLRKSAFDAFTARQDCEENTKNGLWQGCTLMKEHPCEKGGPPQITDQKQQAWDNMLIQADNNSCIET